MRITGLESLHADAGGRNFDFLKVTTDEGIVGWSEYNESFGGPGIGLAIERMAPLAIGRDPNSYESVVGFLHATWRQTSGSVVQQAIGAIENALLDIKAQALGIPVYELFGGPVRERVPLYWSHCGMYRVQWAEEMGLAPLRDLADIVELGREVRAAGFAAAKTNAFLLDGSPRVYRPGFGGRDGFPDLNVDRRLIATMREQLEALREGTGPDVEILFDLNFNFRTEGFLRVARAIEDLDLGWVELDIRCPATLRHVRASTTTPIASCECLIGRREFRPYLEAEAVDVVVVDVPMNGISESIKIASAAEGYEVNIAPHNFYGPLASLISAHFCAAVPNLRTMEIDIDTVPWYDDLVTVPALVEAGEMRLPRGPGWGARVDEEAVRAHPPRTNGSTAHPPVGDRAA